MDRSVLITGCSSGIGRAAAAALQARGWRVFATARKEEDVAELSRLGFSACRLDLSSTGSIREAVDFCLRQTQGRLGALVNNAGYALLGASEDISRQALREQFEVNVFGAHELTQALLPALRKSGRGRIVNIGSTAGSMPLPFMGPYCASKAALAALSESLRHEVAADHIQVSLIEVSSVRSRVADNARAALAKHVDVAASRHRRWYERQDELLRSWRGDCPGPEAVIRSLIHALESPRPKARYRPAPGAWLALLGKLVPDRILSAWIQGRLRSVISLGAALACALALAGRASGAAVPAKGQESEGVQYVLAGEFLRPSRPFRAADFVAVIEALPSLSKTDPELDGRLRQALRERIPAEAVPLMAYLASYASDPCRRRHVRMNLDHPTYQDFYRRTVAAGGLFDRACADLRRKDYRAARGRLDEAISLDPRFLDAYKHLAIVQSLQGEAEAAASNYREGRKSVKEDASASPGQCLCAPALAEPAARLEERRRRGEALKGDGVALFIRGERGAAAAKLSAALTEDPGDPEIYQSRAVVREALGDAPGALDDYAQAAALSTRRSDFQASVLLNLARLRERTGDLAGAQRDLASAIATAPAAWPQWTEQARRLQEMRRSLRRDSLRSGAQVRRIRAAEAVRGRLAAVRSAGRHLIFRARASLRHGFVQMRAALRQALDLAHRFAALPARRVAPRPVAARTLRDRVLAAKDAARRRAAVFGDGMRAVERGLARRAAVRWRWFRSGTSVSILNPLDGTLFPRDIRSPLILWEDADSKDKVWLLRFTFPDPKRNRDFFSNAPEWAPPREVWDDMKAASREKPAALDICGLPAIDAQPRAGARARVGFTTSQDAVGTPIFFRAVPTPFPEPEHYIDVKWKLGWLSSYEPPRVVMEKQTLCFNCHAASLDGKTFGFEVNPMVDGVEDRGGYLVFRNPGRKVVLRKENYFNWNDSLPKSQRAALQGFLSAVSPNGRYYVSSAKAIASVNSIQSGSGAASTTRRRWPACRA